MTRQEVLEALPEVVALLGTWDITTIRASLGMYLCCKKIQEAHRPPGPDDRGDLR